MRGKRYKAAVQTIFEIKGMSKPKGKTWREVGWWVNLSEEDEEQAWEAAIQEAREQATRQQRRGTEATPHDPQQHARDMARFSQLLNKHLEPHTHPQQQLHRGNRATKHGTPTQPTTCGKQQQRGGSPRRAKETASSRQHGDPRCRRRCSHSGGPLQRMAPQSGTRPSPQTMPPEVPIGPDDYLHMRSLGYGGAWGAVIMHRRDDFSGQDRRFSRARQERKDKGESHRGHLAAGTAMVLFPIGAPHDGCSSSVRWRPATISMPPGCRRGRPTSSRSTRGKRVMGPVAQQFFADWRREWTVGRGADRLPAGHWLGTLGGEAHAQTRNVQMER